MMNNLRQGIIKYETTKAHFKASKFEPNDKIAFQDDLKVKGLDKNFKSHFISVCVTEKESERKKWRRRKY